MNYLAQRFLSGQNGFSSGSASLAIVQAYCLAAAQPETYPDLTEEAQQWCRVRAYVYTNSWMHDGNIVEEFQKYWRSISVPDLYQHAADGRYGFAGTVGLGYGNSPPSGWPVNLLPEYNTEGQDYLRLSICFKLL
jgi:hypothetical protein